ncbi:formylglycine-generating enzyme family protein [Fibrobacter sp.]|uniref:formylglycine-generating enzyme family protein n=1 Tax=Fibrobacter sp. TaxID=35828 RepID=UPI00388CFA68
MALLKQLAIASSLMLICSCSTTNEPEDIDVNAGSYQDSSKKTSTSSDNPVQGDDGDFADSDLYKYFDWVNIPAVDFTKGSATYKISTYSMTATEVTQEAYMAVMGELPNLPKKGDRFPVVNVSWYDAVLFCNAFSKGMGEDTVYEYTSVGKNNYLEKLKINYSAAGFRLPTEMEWEVAAHGGTSSAYYWGSEIASDYANYGDANGLAEVGQFIANKFGLYDMAGNAAEWVNDWYDSYNVKDVSNPVGPESGKLRCVRGGSWADPLKDKDENYPLKPATRNKKDPLYTATTLGFRMVYSKGF